jgi:hypothetical protein
MSTKGYALMPDQSFPIPDRRRPATIKHTIVWPFAAWERTQRALAKVSQIAGAPVILPNYIKAAVEKRNAEVLADEETPTP